MFHASLYDGKGLGYTAQDDRQLIDVAVGGVGVIDLGDLLVSAGSGFNSSIAAGRATIRNTFATTQGGLYIVRNDSAVAKQHNASDPTNPRIDKVYCKVYDSETGGDSSDITDIVIQPGTATGGATLDNLTGANPTVPMNSILLADVLVHAGDASAASFTYRDRRPIAVPIVPAAIHTPISAVPFQPLSSLVVNNTNALTTASNNYQSAAAVYLPKRVVGATKIRWSYGQLSTAMTGNYNIGIYDASGRSIVNTGSVAMLGVATTIQTRSETIAATTFEAGIYLLAVGYASLATGSIDYLGIVPGLLATSAAVYSAITPNIWMYSSSGGVTLPTTILNYTDSSVTPAAAPPMIPMVSLSTT